ncbi:uncharacterized protein [Typha angustifolia]|uniref:uncharacterized protein n=1 Tax=Typha angustifolia TaxID=59011 RepID=UPI003C2E2464
MSEECTRSYIDMITTFFCGKWVCGLCSEAVKEHTRHDTAITMEGALESHTALCKNFNKTTRVNPTLSLAGAMRDIARKSSQRRSSDDFRDRSKVERTMSCGPRSDANIRRSSFQ